MNIEKYVIVHKTTGELFAYDNEDCRIEVGFVPPSDILNPYIFKFDFEDSARRFLDGREHGVQHYLSLDRPDTTKDDLVIKKFRFTVEII